MHPDSATAVPVSTGGVVTPEWPQLAYGFSAPSDAVSGKKVEPPPELAKSKPRKGPLPLGNRP